MATKSPTTSAQPVKPKSLRDLVLELQAGIADRDGLLKLYHERIQAAQDEATAVRTEVVTARASLDKAREQFGDLKERLFNAEMLNSRLMGYVDRVASDDLARDEPVQIGERTLAEIQPRRPRVPYVTPPRGIDMPDVNFRDGGRVHANPSVAGESLGGRKSGHWSTW